MLSLKTEIKAEIRATEVCGARENGRLIRRIPFRKCHSLLKAFIQILYSQFGQTYSHIKDTAGVDQYETKHANNFKANADSDTTYGIVIGSGEANPVAMDDFKLETQMTANIGHNAVTFSAESPESGKWRLTISRGFVNNTGAVVNVKEVGLYVYFGTSERVCVDRTLYDVSFGDGVTLTLTYRFTISL